MIYLCLVVVAVHIFELRRNQFEFGCCIWGSSRVAQNMIARSRHSLKVHALKNLLFGLLPVSLKRNTTSYSFLNLGCYSWVGKGLALAELGFLIALLVSKYDINFASGRDGSRVLGDLRSHFTAAPGELMLRFAKRKAGYVMENLWRLVILPTLNRHAERWLPASAQS